MPLTTTQKLVLTTSLVAGVVLAASIASTRVLAAQQAPAQQAAPQARPEATPRATQGATPRGIPAQPSVPVMGTRLFTGPDGNTHAEKIDVSGITNILQNAKLTFRRVPAGEFQEYHRGPRRQYVITLSGHADIELMDGTKVRQEPGQVLLVEDTTGTGHRARIFPDQDLVTVFVPLGPRD